MADSPYTLKRLTQSRGPDSSEDYNARLEENFKDLVYLYNKLHQLDADLGYGLLIFLKNQMGIGAYLTDLQARVEVLEAAIPDSIPFISEEQIDTDLFDNTIFAVNAVDRCTYNETHNLVTLPIVPTSSMSKIKFTNNDGTYSIPSSFETLVVPITSTADNSSAVIDTSQPYAAVVGHAGKVWERNVITSAPDADGAQMYLYVKIPDDLSAVADTNAISFTPFPFLTVDILEIAYSTDVNVTLGSAGSNWTIFNSAQTYYNAPGAAGHIIPGGWSGDAIINASSQLFYFDPKPITAIRIKFRQENYHTESTKTIYSYGLSKLDIRYDKFTSSGKTIIRFDAPGASTISSVTSVMPYIWNVPEYQVGDIFSYRVIWETSFESGSYTLTPVPSSQRVWIEVTLNETPAKGSPALSGLILKYS
jgi:hypothetical protein